MVSDKHNFGLAGEFQITLSWKDEHPGHGPVAKTWGELTLWVRDRLVWGRQISDSETEGITWCWIDLLEFLGIAWPYLVEEEQYPFDFGAKKSEPVFLSEFWNKATHYLDQLSDAEADQKDARLRDFLLVHDFAEGLQGAFPPKLLLLRRGKQMLAATKEREAILSFDQTMAALECFGSAIMTRLSGLKDARSERACSYWVKRNAFSNIKRLAIATMRDEASLRRIWPNDVDVANDRLYRLKAAARMIGQRLPDEQLKDVLAVISQLSEKTNLNVAEMDCLWKKSAKILSELDFEPPWLQGYRLASMLRLHLGRPDGSVDPEQVLVNWRVAVREINIEEPCLDAIAVWDEKRCATVLINKAGLRAQLPTGRRSTLAHEICHILVDLDGALPMIEVLGGAAPRCIEQRADAFAAEFLLPRSLANAYVENARSGGKNISIQTIVNALVNTYGTSHEMTAWQVMKSPVLDDVDKKWLQTLRNSVNNAYSDNETAIN